MKRGKRIAGGPLGAVVVVMLMLGGVQLWNVHHMTSDWMLWSKEVPSKVQFADRDYQCGPKPEPNTRSLDGLSKQGKTAGGADIYAADPEKQNGAEPWIVLETDKSTYTCNLMGGP